MADGAKPSRPLALPEIPIPQPATAFHIPSYMLGLPTLFRTVIISDEKGSDMGTIKAVCVSDAKGVQKEEVGSAVIEPDFGIVGDAHAGKWHRQVSLLSYESIEDFKARGAEVVDGSFGENLIVEGIDVKALPVGTQLASGDIRMEITQIGKQCHSHCAIYHRMGDCIMPREGVFAKVLTGGTVAKGDTIEVCE